MSATDRDAADAALSEHLGRRVHLESRVADDDVYESYWPEVADVMLSDVSIDLPIAMSTAKESFVDLAALQMVTTASLARLASLAPDSAIVTRRFRPSLVIDTGPDADGFVENEWRGRRARLGDRDHRVHGSFAALCHDHGRAGRSPRDLQVLRTLARHNRIETPGLGNFVCLGIYAEVTTPGRSPRATRSSCVRPPRRGSARPERREHPGREVRIGADLHRVRAHAGPYSAGPNASTPSSTRCASAAATRSSPPVARAGPSDARPDRSSRSGRSPTRTSSDRRRLRRSSGRAGSASTAGTGADAARHAASGSSVTVGPSPGASPPCRGTAPGCRTRAARRRARSSPARRGCRPAVVGYRGDGRRELVGQAVVPIGDLTHRAPPSSAVGRSGTLRTPAASRPVPTPPPTVPDRRRA